MINDLQAIPADLITKKPDDLSAFIKGKIWVAAVCPRLTPPNDNTKRQHLQEKR
jgi:hypothetical protein